MNTTENNQKTLTELVQKNHRLYNEYKKYDTYRERIWKASRFLSKYVDMHIKIDYKVYYKTIAWERYLRIMEILNSRRNYFHNIAIECLNKQIENDKEIDKILGL